MENIKLYDLQLRSLVISETNKGLEVARQLKINLKTLSSLLSQARDCEFLVNMIIESQNRVLSLLEPANGLQSVERDNNTPLTNTTVAAITTLESAPSPNGNPISDESDVEDFKNDDNNSSNYSIKRNGTSVWSNYVRVYPKSLPKGCLADGHNWRKYGQKLINGAKYPRSYYRCTQSLAQGCCARRLVQRRNDDPTILQITYIREHTCKPIESSIPASAPKKQQELNALGQDNINIVDTHHQDEHSLLGNTKHQHFPNDLSVDDPPPSSNNNALTVENSPFSLPNYPTDENLYYPRILSPCREYYTHNYVNVHEMVEKASTSTANIADMNLDYSFSMFGSSGFFT